MNKNTTTTVRVTKAQKYNAIIDLLNGGKPTVIPASGDKQGVTLDAKYLAEFCKAELALLSKKNSNTGNKKLTKAQELNEGFKKEILAYLRANPSLLVSASDIMGIMSTAHPDTLWSNQKAASLLNAMSDKFDKDIGDLVSEGVLLRNEGKGKTKTTFQIKPEYVNADESDAEAEADEG